MYPTNDGCLVAYVQNQQNDCSLVKIHSDGKVDSTHYHFKGDDRGGIAGTIFTNSNGEFFIYDRNFDNQFEIIHFDSDINFVANTCFSVNPDYRIEGNWPIPLGNGEFAVLVMSYTEMGVMERNLYEIDSRGELKKIVPFNFTDEYIFSVSGVYRYGDTYIVLYDNAQNENTLTFLDLNGTRKATVTIPGFSLVSPYFFNNYLYALVHTYDDRYGESFSLYKYSLDGTLLTTSHSMRISTMEEINEVGDRLYVTGYINAPSQKQGTPAAFVGKIFSIDKETLTDIDTIVMSYNSIPLSVFSDGNNGYNVFLSRKFNYDNTQYMNLDIDNIYIYNVDDLHNLQIESQQ